MTNSEPRSPSTAPSQPTATARLHQHCGWCPGMQLPKTSSQALGPQWAVGAVLEGMSEEGERRGEEEEDVERERGEGGREEDGTKKGRRKGEEREERKRRRGRGERFGGGRGGEKLKGKGSGPVGASLRKWGALATVAKSQPRPVAAPRCRGANNLGNILGKGIPALPSGPRGGCPGFMLCVGGRPPGHTNQL